MSKYSISQIPIQIFVDRNYNGRFARLVVNAVLKRVFGIDYALICRRDQTNRRSFQFSDFRYNARIETFYGYLESLDSEIGVQIRERGRAVVVVVVIGRVVFVIYVVIESQTVHGRAERDDHFFLISTDVCPRHGHCLFESNYGNFELCGIFICEVGCAVSCRKGLFARRGVVETAYGNVGVGFEQISVAYSRLDQNLFVHGQYAAVAEIYVLDVVFGNVFRVYNTHECGNFYCSHNFVFIIRKRHRLSCDGRIGFFKSGKYEL